MQKYLVIIVALIVFISGFIIDFNTQEAVHVPMSFFTIPFSIILLLMGIIYLTLCNLQVKSKNEPRIIQSCIFITTIIPLLFIVPTFLHVIFGISIEGSFLSEIYKAIAIIFFLTQIMALTFLIMVHR